MSGKASLMRGLAQLHCREIALDLKMDVKVMTVAEFLEQPGNELVLQPGLGFKDPQKASPLHMKKPPPSGGHLDLTIRDCGVWFSC